MATARELVKETLNEWINDEAPRLGASLAYYAVFSMAPLLVIVIAVVGFVYKDNSVLYIQNQLKALFGHDAATTLANAIHNAGTRGHGVFATIMGFVVLFLGATGVFSELHLTMNKIWKAPPKQYGIVFGLLKDRFAAFTMVLGIAFLLLISMVISAVLSAVITYFSGLLPGFDFMWRLADFAISFGVVTLLFAAMFRYVPDTRIAWRDVWIGAVATAVLFDIGKFLIGLYLGKSGIGSTFGAAGSIVVTLAWVYYTSQPVFLGAEFTHVYSLHHGTRAVTGIPFSNAPHSSQDDH